MTDKAHLLRALLTVAEQRTTDPELFEAARRLARTDGEALAAEVVRACVGRPDTAALEDAAFAAASSALDARRDQLRRDGVGENEVAAYTATATLTMVEAMARVVEEFRAVARAPVQ